MRKQFIGLLFAIIMAFSAHQKSDASGLSSGLSAHWLINPQSNSGQNPMPVSGCDTVLPSSATLRSASVEYTDAVKGEILINFNTVSDKYLKGYIVFRSINGGSYKEIDTFYYLGKGIYQYFDNNLNTLKNTYSYFFESLDSCGNIATPADTHTTVHITAVPQNGKNNISWSPYKGFSNPEYIVYRRSGTLTWSKIAELNGSIKSYSDSSIYCNKLYTYQILVRNKNSNLDSAYSNYVSATAYKTTPPLPPTLINATVTVTSNNLGQIQINWIGSLTSDIAKYIIYRRESNSAWLPIASVGNTITSYTDINLDTYAWPYDYKIISLDSCGNYSPDNDIYHRTVFLKVKAENQMISLNWNTYWGFAVNHYTIYKNGKIFKTFDSTVLQCTDSATICPNAYNYVIQAIGTDTSSFSNRDSAVPFDTTPPLPPYIRNASVKTPNSSVEISWLPSISNDAFGYKIYRSIAQEQNRLIQQKNGPDSTYTDTIALNSNTVCYQLVAYDHCGNSSSPSNSACTINLTGNANPLNNIIDWNKYNGWTDGVQKYDIYRNNDEGGWIFLGSTPASQIEYIDQDLSDKIRDFCYRVEAVENAGKFNSNSWSTEICLSQPPIVYIPEAFTPDYSFNLNDYFGPIGSYFSSYNMKIFDRWGERVYETNSGKPWNGYFKNEPAAPGIYQYQIDIQGFNGNSYQFRGIVDIVN